MVAHGGVPAVDGVDLDLAAGEVVALMGRNGAGKSTLLWALRGDRRDAGSLEVAGEDPRHRKDVERSRVVGLVPQVAADLLYLDTVDAELAAADRGAGAEPGRARGLLDAMVPGVPAGAHPRDLSEGQRLALVLALVLAGEPPVVVLDEPTRGLDYPGKEALARVLGDLAGRGHGVLVATHDVEFAARVADRVVVLAEGEVVSAGPARQVLAESPSFAPQVTKVLGAGWLVPGEVPAAAGTAPAGGAR